MAGAPSVITRRIARLNLRGPHKTDVRLQPRVRAQPESKLRYGPRQADARGRTAEVRPEFSAEFEYELSVTTTITTYLVVYSEYAESSFAQRRQTQSEARP